MIGPDCHPMRWYRSEEHTSELQSRRDLVCRLLLEKKKTTANSQPLGIGFYLRAVRSAPCAVRLYAKTIANISSLELSLSMCLLAVLFFFNGPATPEIYPLSPTPASPI